MKKTFSLTHEKIKPARLVDSIKHEVKKNRKRERNKTAPVDADYWDVDCKYGATEQEAEDIHMKEINKSIDKAVAAELTSFYLEIMVKPAVRKVNPFTDEALEE